MGFGRVSKNLASLLQPEARALQRIRGSARLYREGSKDSYSKAFGPTNHLGYFEPSGNSSQQKLYAAVPQNPSPCTLTPEPHLRLQTPHLKPKPKGPLSADADKLYSIGASIVRKGSEYISSIVIQGRKGKSSVRNSSGPQH